MTRCAVLSLEDHTEDARTPASRYCARNVSSDSSALTLFAGPKSECVGHIEVDDHYRSVALWVPTWSRMWFMRGLLVLHRCDWLAPRAGAFEVFLHEVLRRVAVRGNYVAWVSARAGLNPFGKRLRNTEVSEDIQIVRLGIEPLYPFSVRTFLSGLTRNRGMFERFDVVVNCVCAKPLPVSDWIELPELPVVLRLPRGMRVSDETAGPVVALGPAVSRSLVSAGLAENRLVEIPFAGEQACDYESAVDLLLGAIEDTCSGN